MKAKDLTNKKFGRLKTTEKIRRHNGKRYRTYYLCKCDCGKIVEVRCDQLTRGIAKSCGCLQREITGLINKGKSTATLTHGLSHSRLYKVFRNMKTRCYNPNSHDFKNYGGRGITICDEWLNDFTAFYDWSLRNGYNDTLTIDRIDTNGNYTPDNCRWTTYYVQSRNKTNNKWITYKGETKCLEDWAKTKNLTSSKLKQRLELYGWSLEKSLETPPMKNGRFITYKGITKNITEWAKELGIKPDILAQRLRAGWNIEKAFETKVNKNKSRSCRIKGGGLMNE